MAPGLTGNVAGRRSSRHQATPRTQSPVALPQSPVKPNSSGKRKIPHRITVACSTCRNQHLRCDGLRPRCTRCRQGNKRCVYKDIRRESRRLQCSAESTLRSHASPQPQNEFSQSTWSVSESPGSSGTRYTTLQDGMYSLGSSAELLDDPFATPAPVHPRQSKAFDEFYSSFFKGHPFVLPKSRLLQQFDADSASVEHILKAISFVGSLYMLDPASHGYRAAVESDVANGLPRTGFSVQCLLLFAGALEWSGEQDFALATLNKAKSLALEIGLNSQSFAHEHGQGCTILEESWRRTWWELYIIDAIFAGTRHSSTFDLWHTEYDACLPCEEMAYDRGVSKTRRHCEVG